MARTVSHEWLKARTLHIKGIPEEDRTGDGLKFIIEQFIKNHCEGGKILAI